MSLASVPRAAQGTGVVDAGALWVEFRSRLRAFVARRIDAADVDDTVQWVFLRLHENRAGLERADRVHAWLYRTARHAIADYYRTRARRRETAAGSAADLDALGATRPAEDEADIRQAEACVAPLVESLPLPYREAIVMADLEQVRLADAARAAGVSLSGMKSRVQRGRKRLKQLLLDCCHDALERGGLAGCAAGPCGCCGPRA